MRRDEGAREHDGCGSGSPRSRERRHWLQRHSGGKQLHLVRALYRQRRPPCPGTCRRPDTSPSSTHPGRLHSGTAVQRYRPVGYERARGSRQRRMGGQSQHKAEVRGPAPPPCALQAGQASGCTVDPVSRRCGRAPCCVGSCSVTGGVPISFCSPGWPPRGALVSTCRQEPRQGQASRTGVGWSSCPKDSGAAAIKSKRGGGGVPATCPSFRGPWACLQAHPG
jgi:hypothetical protein